MATSGRRYGTHPMASAPRCASVAVVHDNLAARMSDSPTGWLRRPAVAGPRLVRPGRTPSSTRRARSCVRVLEPDGLEAQARRRPRRCGARRRCTPCAVGSMRVAADEPPPDLRVGLADALVAGHDDALEPVQEREQRPRPREGLGRPVGERVDMQAAVADLGQDGDGALDGSRQHLLPAVHVGPDQSARAGDAARCSSAVASAQVRPQSCSAFQSGLTTSRRKTSISSGSANICRYRWRGPSR